MIFNRFALNVTHLLRVVRLHSRRGLLAFPLFRLHYLSLDHEIAFLPPSRPVFSSSTLRPHFNNNAAFCERRILFFLFPTSSFLVRFQLLSCFFAELRWSCPSTPFSIRYISYLVLHSPFELLVISANSLRFISTIFKPVAAASIRRDKSPRSRQHIIAIQPLELNDQASLAVPERISACPMNY
ncbi:hypothetical protein FPOAC1_011150 [Fusarium poae]|uniref:hypothetical protein n=1 Tax=Fusarium poae TaxID=36050 RepID=UPI001CEBD0BD|nr:hypothetical protein FPOAC1_011150 [Fusarium poae]KAG8666345.1 hypothetical protein FPOAC1_011150 [Fusarium poae]